MKFSAGILIAYLLLASSALATEFSARYLASAQQLWFFHPLAQKSVYRLCVTTFGPDGAPQREIVANEAAYTDGVWSIRSGREITFKVGSLEVQSAKTIVGVRPELSLNPEDPTAANSQIEEIGRTILFSEKNTRPAYVNVSMITFDDRSQVVTYLFARRAMITTKNKNVSIALNDVLFVRSWADSRMPEIATMEGMQSTLSPDKGTE